ncbi:MAG: 3D domain-containing protein [Planctomycetota bacterium]
MRSDKQSPSIRQIVTRQRLLVGTSGVCISAFCLLLGWSAARAFEQPGKPVPLTALEDGRDAVDVDARPGVPWNNRPMGIRPAPRVEVQPAPAPAGPARQTAPDQDESTQATPAPASPMVVEGARYDRSGNVIMVGGRVWTGAVYDGRPIRPVRTMTMSTTAYSPDHRSCGKWADGITASGMSVWTNGMKLVAADPAIPFGTILSIPGYNGGRPVPVLDRGGAIKGNKLDLLYPTHEIALQWGVQRKVVTVWEYVEAD